MKLGIVAHIPAPNFGYPKVFLENLKKFKPKVGELLLYSSHKDYGLTPIPDPESVKNVHPFAVNNFVFFLGLKEAIQRGFDWIIYLEADCRVGVEGWDEVMAKEFFDGKEAVCGGTMLCYNPFNANRETAEEFVNFITKHNGPKNMRKPVTVRVPRVGTYGSKGMNDSSGCALFPNGAFGIYSVAVLKSIFGKNDVLQLAKNKFAWDLEIGKGLWSLYGKDVFSKVKQLNSIYSSYGNVITTEEERRLMLTSGDVVGVHQIKSSWTP